MTEPDPDPSAEPGMGSERPSTTGTPRWVKVSGIVVGVLILLFLVLQLSGVGGGGHGPGRHLPAPGVTPSSTTSGDHTPPSGSPTP